MGKVKEERKFTKQSFMQGILSLMLSQVLIKILGLIYKLYLTNKEGFGDKGNAIYSSGFQIYALLLTLSSTGVPSAISKLVSERASIGDHKGAHRIFKIAFVSFTIIGLVGTFILFFGAKYISNVWLQIPEAELTLVALSPSIFFVSISSVMRGYFNGREDLKATAKSQSVEQLFKTIITIILVEIIAIMPSGNTVFMAAGANLATTLSTFLSYIYIYIYYKYRREDIGVEISSSTKLKIENIKSVIRKILYVSIPMSLSSVLMSLNKSIDSVTVVRGLKNFLTENEAHIQYGILSGKVDTLTTLPLSFNIALATALVPAIASSKAKRDMNTGVKRVSFALLVTLLIGLPCTVGLIIFADPILNLLFPNANKGALILQISSMAIIFTVLEQTVYGALQGLGRLFVPTMSIFIGVSVKLLLNLVLVPNYNIGIIGASFGTVICHTISFLISFKILRNNMKLNLKFSKHILKPIIATVMMATCSYCIYLLLVKIIINKIALIIALLVAVIVYILSIISLKVFSKDEIFMLPYGKKIYHILEKIGIYKASNILVK